MEPCSELTEYVRVRRFQLRALSRTIEAAEAACRQWSRDRAMPAHNIAVATDAAAAAASSASPTCPATVKGEPCSRSAVSCEDASGMSASDTHRSLAAATEAPGGRPAGGDSEPLDASHAMGGSGEVGAEAAEAAPSQASNPAGEAVARAASVVPAKAREGTEERISWRQHKMALSGQSPRKEAGGLREGGKTQVRVSPVGATKYTGLPCQCFLQFHRML